MATLPGTRRTLRVQSVGRVLAVVVSVGAFLLAIGAVECFKLIHFRAVGLGLGVLLLAGMLTALRAARVVRRTGAFLALCGVAFALSRLAVVALIPTEPVSDFHSYLVFAQAMAHGADLRKMWGFFAWGYPVALAPLFALVAPQAHVLAAQLLNIALGIAALLMLHRLVRLTIGPVTARAVVVLFLFWPAQLLFTPVLASEHLALVLALLYLLRIVAVAQGRSAGGGAAAAGVILGLAYAVRPALGVLLPVGLLAWASARRRGNRWMHALLLIAVFAMTQTAYRELLLATYHRAPPNVGWWNLLAGTNHEARGQWNRRDAERFFQRRTTPEERNRFARREIWRRITTPGIAAHANLVRRKLKLLWSDGRYGAYWSTVALRDGALGRAVATRRDDLYMVSQIFHLFLLLACGCGAWRLAARRPTRGVLLFTLVILSGSTLHSIFETQGRYSFVFTVGVLAFAAVAGLELVRKPIRHRSRASGLRDCDSPTSPPIRA